MVYALHVPGKAEGRQREQCSTRICLVVSPLEHLAVRFMYNVGRRFGITLQVGSYESAS